MYIRLRSNPGHVLDLMTFYSLKYRTCLLNEGYHVLGVRIKSVLDMMTFCCLK